MKTNKLDGNRYVVVGLLSIPVLITSSLLVRFNVVDALFLLFIIITAIRYFVIVKND